MKERADLLLSSHTYGSGAAFESPPVLAPPGGTLPIIPSPIPPGGGDQNGGDQNGGDQNGGDADGGDTTDPLDKILEEFRNALATYIIQPGFVTGAGGVGGWSIPVADWLRRNTGLLEQRFLERYMQQQTGGGDLVEYTPMDFLAQLQPEVMRRMTPTFQPTGRMPAVTTRRLRV